MSDQPTRRRLKLFHGTRQAPAILAQGFDLSKIKPRWVNDLAISTLTTAAAVSKYMGKAPGMQVLGMTFNGVLANPDQARAASGLVVTPQAYRQSLLQAGIDAVMLDGSGARQVYVYNLKALSGIHLVEPGVQAMAARVAAIWLDQSRIGDRRWKEWDEPSEADEIRHWRDQEDKRLETVRFWRAWSKVNRHADLIRFYDSVPDDWKKWTQAQMTRHQENKARFPELESHLDGRIDRAKFKHWFNLLARTQNGEAAPSSHQNTPGLADNWMTALSDLLRKVQRRGDTAATDIVQKAIQTLQRGETLDADTAKAVRWRMHQNGLGAQTGLFKSAVLDSQIANRESGPNSNDRNR